MLGKIAIFLLLQIAVLAEEKPFLDLKKVIRSALDVVAAVPTTTPSPNNSDDASRSNISNGIQERLSKLFHIPPDFVHRLAAQAGFIDYEPTTAKPLPNYWFKSKPHMSYVVNTEYGTGSAFIQEDASSIASNSANDLSAIVVPEQGNSVNSSQIISNHSAFKQQDAILQSEQQLIIFQPVIKDGHLYYQPFGVSSYSGQPKMIIFGGQLYMATPLQSEIDAQEITMDGDGMIAKNSSEVIDKNGNDDKVSNISNESNEEMHYRRIYAQHMKAAKDVQTQAAKLQQVIVPDDSSIEILGIKSKARTSSPYRKVYKKELKSYNAMNKFDLKEKPQEINANFSQENMAENDQHEVTKFQGIISVTPYNQFAKIPKYFAVEREISNSSSNQLSFNQNFKQYEEIDNIATDRRDIEEKTMTTPKRTNKFRAKMLSREKVENDANTAFMGNNQKMRRILALRRKMAADRKRFAERKQLLLSMKQKTSRDDDMNKEIFRRHCYNIRSLAQQFGFTDIKEYVILNCAFIENYYPEFKCEKAEVSVDKCKRLF